MKRRELLAIGGIGITATAGCYGISQALSSDESDNNSENSSQEDESLSTGEEKTNTTDTEPSEPETTEETSQENESGSKTNETEDQNTTDSPDEDPTDAVAIVEHQMVFEEAADPNYESDELYIQMKIRNTNTHPIKDVRLEGYAYAAGEQVGHEYLEYAALEGGGEREDDIPFYVDDPSSVERYELTVTAAQWA